MWRVILTVLVLFVLIIFCAFGFAFLFPDKTVNTPFWKLSQFVNQYRNNGKSLYNVERYGMLFQYPKDWKVEENRLGDCEDYNAENGIKPCSFITISNEKAELQIKVTNKSEDGKFYAWGESGEQEKTGELKIEGKTFDVTKMAYSGKTKFIIFGDSANNNVKDLNFIARLEINANSQDEFYSSELKPEEINSATKIVESFQIK